MPATPPEGRTRRRRSGPGRESSRQRPGREWPAGFGRRPRADPGIAGRSTPHRPPPIARRAAVAGARAPGCTPVSWSPRRSPRRSSSPPWAGPAPVTVAALLVAVLLVASAWVRFRGRWLFEWLATAAGHLTRRRALAGPAGPRELLDLVAPGTVVRSTELPGGPAAVLEDTGGMVALLELGDPGDLLGDAPRVVPAPSALLPPTGPDVPAAAGPTAARRRTGPGAGRRAARSARRTGSSPTGGSPDGSGRCSRSGCCGWTAGPRRTCAGRSPARYAGSSAGSGR